MKMRRRYWPACKRIYIKKSLTERKKYRVISLVMEKNHINADKYNRGLDNPVVCPFRADGMICPVKRYDYQKGDDCMSVSGISGLGYGSSFGYSNSTMVDDWYSKANSASDQLKSSLNIDTNESTKTGSTTSSTSTSSTSSSSSTKTSGTSTFLMQYQSALEDLEKASAKLQTSQADNVFSKYEKAAASGDESAIKKASDDIISAAQDFVNKYNSTASLLKNNAGRSASLSSQLSAFERAIPNDKALKVAGMKINTDGKLSLDQEKLGEALEKDYGLVKDIIGGQYGMAERAGSKASSVLDTSIDKIIGTATNGTNSASGSSAKEGLGSTSLLSSNGSALSDSFMYFAKFAQSSPYSLSNYYMVGSLLNTLA